MQLDHLESSKPTATPFIVFGNYAVIAGLYACTFSLPRDMPDPQQLSTREDFEKLIQDYDSWLFDCDGRASPFLF